MTLRALIGLAVLLLTAGAAQAEERASATVCGAKACAAVPHMSLQFSGSNMFVRRVAPAPYSIVTITLPPNVGVPGADDPIVYVPRRGVWRVTFDGAPVWLVVPDVDAARLERAIRGLRPRAAPARWP